jgi:hypothetical protein
LIIQDGVEKSEMDFTSCLGNSRFRADFEREVFLVAKVGCGGFAFATASQLEAGIVREIGGAESL